MVFMKKKKKSTTFHHKRYPGCYEDFHFVIIFVNRDTSFYDVIANIYDEMVSKMFDQHHRKPHVKKLSVNPPPCIEDTEL